MIPSPSKSKRRKSATTLSDQYRLNSLIETCPSPLVSFDFSSGGNPGLRSVAAVKRYECRLSPSLVVEARPPAVPVNTRPASALSASDFDRSPLPESESRRRPQRPASLEV